MGHNGSGKRTTNEHAVYFLSGDDRRTVQVGTISTANRDTVLENQRRGKLLENMRYKRIGQTALSGPTVKRNGQMTPAYQVTNTPASPKQKANAENALNSEVEYLINNASREKGMLVDPVGFRKDMNKFVDAVKNGKSKTANRIASEYMGTLALDNNNEQREEIMTLLERMSDLRKAYRKK